jgi:hypothetical protein
MPVAQLLTFRRSDFYFLRDIRNRFSRKHPPTYGS